jgi:hypothetical protein
MRAAIIGDVSGWGYSLETALSSIGCDPETGSVPDDLIVIQVGDLVHKGADSTGAVAVADRILLSDRWIQLCGNHEGQYLGGPSFWRPEISVHLAADLNRWFEEGQIRAAHALDTVEYGPVLITHAGLTAAKWKQFGENPDVHVVANLLNEEFATDPERSLTPGAMLGMAGPPGVAWTEPTVELFFPWSHFPGLPFTQVNGHASPYDWHRHQWSPLIEAQTWIDREVDEAIRHTKITWPNSHALIGVDPGFGVKGPDIPLVPLVLELA